jgi:hypothetical protein
MVEEERVGMASTISLAAVEASLEMTSTRRFEVQPLTAIPAKFNLLCGALGRGKIIELVLA